MKITPTKLNHIIFYLTPNNNRKERAGKYNIALKMQQDKISIFSDNMLYQKILFFNVLLVKYMNMNVLTKLHTFSNNILFSNFCKVFFLSFVCFINSFSLQQFIKKYYNNKNKWVLYCIYITQNKKSSLSCYRMLL